MVTFFIGYSLNVLNLSNYEIFLIMKSNADIVIRKRELKENLTQLLHFPGAPTIPWGYLESKEPTVLHVLKLFNVYFCKCFVLE